MKLKTEYILHQKLSRLAKIKQNKNLQNTFAYLKVTFGGHHKA